MVRRHSVVSTRLTIDMEIVARAKGSPIIFSMLIPLIPPERPLTDESILPFILRSDGECSDP